MKAIWIRRALAVAATALLALALLGAFSAYREMRHEGLTYSQWYEGAIDGFYTCLLAVVASGGLCAAAWAALARRGAGAPTRRRAWPAALAAALLIACIALSVRDYRALGAARAANEESLAPYIRAYGIHRVLGLMALEGLTAAAIAALRRRRK